MQYELHVSATSDIIRCKGLEIQQYRHLVLSGNSVTVFISEDGDEWEQLGKGALQAVFAE